ncbi:hypothetical protein ABBQ32_011899 [Trebouxia sp. C0010 RCD-2024]
MTDRYRSDRSNRSAYAEDRVVQLPDLSDSLWRAISGYRPHRYPRSTGIFALWLFGLFAVFLSPAPVKVTQEKLDRYAQLVTQAQGDPKVRTMTEQRLWEATMYTEEAKVWFWRFRSPHSEIVKQRLAKQYVAQSALDKLNKQRAALMSEAKSQLGLWSDAGVEESKQTFWKSFEAGKVFGRRQTLWDAIVTVIAGQERNAMGMLVKVVFSALVNFTIGMVSSVFVFVFKLPWIVADYKPGWVSGTAFFMVALTGAVSVITAFLGALYGTSAAGIYAAVSLVNANSRLQGPQGGRAAHIQYHTD